MTEPEVAAVVEAAHAAGLPVVAHAHREAEIRLGLKYGVDCFEHTGLGTEPGYPEDILEGLRRRNATLYWTPTIAPLFLRSEEHTPELQSPDHLVCRLLLEKKQSRRRAARGCWTPAPAPPRPTARPSGRRRAASR